MISRREFVKLGAVAAGVTVAGSAAGIAVWEVSARPEDPQRAWDEARGLDRVVLAATLAASSHNTQPWRFRMSDSAIDVLGDRGRTMGAADPRLRELHVSLGCALENAAIAAADAGMPVAIEQVPGGPGAHFARLTFGDDGGSTSHADLASAIPTRRTNRAAFDPARPVAQTTLDGFAALAEPGVRVEWLTSPADRAKFTSLSVEATTAQVADAAMQRDSHRWYRMRRSDAEEERDGITVRGANLPPAVALMLGLMPPTPDSFDEGWAKATSETHCGTAPAFGLLVVERDSDRASWINAGRTYQRLQLAATRKGIATHPISQALGVRDREVATDTPGVFSAGLRELGGAGEVVLAFRIGVPVREQQPSLRRSPVVERG